LTYNEEQNIDRTLSRLIWAKDIVVVDNGSSDGTVFALAKFSNVRVFNRHLDTQDRLKQSAVPARVRPRRPKRFD
jgi:glycosyltransferase involved in cell wall biosynthesis